MSVGTHTVVIADVDVSCLVDSVSIVHGRDDPGSQPEASAATVEFTSTPDGPLPPEVEIGASVVVKTTTPSGSSTRFIGRVTDLSLGWDEAGEETPDSGVGQLVAVGPLADLGRRVVGDTPWPVERDGARVARVMSAAGAPLDPVYSDPGTVDLLARDVDAQPALDLARAAAESASGVLYETRGGEIRYSDADHRRGIVPSLALDSCDLLVSPAWRRNIEGLVNEVSIGYGDAGEGEQPRYTATSPESVARWGRYGYTSATELAALSDAQAVGQLLLARNSSPVWVMASLPVDVEGLDAARYEALLGLDVHSLLTLTGLPSLGTAPTQTSLWVEGYHETLAYGVHEVEITVSGYCRTVPPPRWDDLDPSWVWGTSTLTETRRNLAQNPIGPLSTALGWWLPSRGSLALGPDGLAIRLTINDASTSSMAQRLDSPGGGQIVATPGAYTISADLRTNTAASGAVALVFQDSGGAVLLNAVGPPVALSSGQYTRASHTATAPAGTVRVVARAGLHTGARALGQWVDVRRVLVERAPAGGAFFDGDTTDTATSDYAWAGAPRASESVASAIAVTGGGLPAYLLWDSAACMGPPINVGRWNDQPATLRWDQLDRSIAWDDYPSGA